jgi:hypothetical protein
MTQTHPKHYKLVGIHGHCAVLAQILGTDPTGEDIPTFFAAFMITKDGKNAVSFAECSCMVRITRNCKYDDSLIGFCKGYSQATQERRGGVSPQDWFHQQTIEAVNVEELRWDSQELRRLRAYPKNPPTVDDECFELRPIQNGGPKAVTTDTLA